jgi:hypothetical protein
MSRAIAAMLRAHGLAHATVLSVQATFREVVPIVGFRSRERRS